MKRALAAAAACYIKSINIPTLDILCWSKTCVRGREASCEVKVDKALVNAAELTDYAGGKKWQGYLQDSSHDPAKRTMLDAATFASAYDDGAFQH